MFERLIREIHRRSMWQIFAIFMASGWAVLQVIDSLIDNGILPAWVFKAGLVLLLLGLPVVLATAFVQEGLPGSSNAPDRATSGERMVGDVAAESAAVNLAAGTGSLDRVSTRAPRHHRLFTWRNALLGGVAAFALLGVGAGGWMSMRMLGIGPAGTLAAQGVLERGAAVVLADFASVDDAELGDVVTRTLRVDLMQSPMIRVLEPADLRAPLERMRSQADTAITADVAMQLAEREGYAAVITGEVARAGSGYVLTADIRAGEGFRAVAAFRETARGEDELVDAIERLSRAIRDKAGESLRSVRAGASLAQVTTSSMPALRAYTRGDAISDTGDWGAALEHYERAIALDSSFAMAYRKLGALLLNLRVRRADAVRAYRRAYQLRDRLPDFERQLATGNYHDRVDGDITAAAHAYEEAVALDSTSAAARNQLGNVYGLLGRHDEAAQQYTAALRTRPVAALFNNLVLARYRMGDTAGALAAADSGVALLPAWLNGHGLKAALAARHFDFSTADSLVAVLRQNARTAADRTNGRRLQFLLAAVRGRLREAEQVLDGPVELDLADPLLRAAWRAQLFLLRGDTAAAVQLVRQALTRTNANPEDMAFLWAAATMNYAQDVAAAEHALHAWQTATPDDELGFGFRIARGVVAAELQRERRDFDASLAALRDARARCPGCGSYMDHVTARAYDAMGQADLAIRAYEQALARPDPSALSETAFDIPHALRRLGELHDAQGNSAKAVEYYARFTALWKGADPELQPVVRRVQQRLQALALNRG